MSWEEDLNNLFDLATLHSWCTQINQMIEAFVLNYKKEPAILDFLDKIIKEQNTPREHSILSIILLNFFGHPIDGIIHLTDLSLYGKINKNDISFLKDYLFEGDFPLSNELSFDITNRAYLSPKIAIKKAMEIDSVISRKNPSLTVLYMTLILSRMDMNEENKAMVAFLLLRMDVNLQDSLKERVFKYLMVYKDVIKELLDEEKGEPFEIDNMSDIHKIVTKINIVEEAIGSKSKSLISNNNLTDSLNLTIPEQTIEGNREDDQIVLTKKHAVKRNKNAGKRINKEDKADNLITQNSIVQNDEKNAQNIISEKQKIVSSNKISGYPDDSKENFFYKNEISDIKKDMSSVYKKESAQEEVQIGTIPNKISGNKKNWQIGLKDSKLILISLLTNAGNISTKIYNSRKNNIYKIKIKNIKNILIFSAGIIGILLVITVVLIKNDNNSDKEITPVSAIISKESEINRGTELNSNKILPNKEDIISTESLNNLPEYFPFKLSISNGQIAWEVIKDDSITDFFYALQDYKEELKNTKLNFISIMKWEQFFSTIVKNNPPRDSYHIIYPGEVFTLPVK
jgi:hypothetical protein